MAWHYSYVASSLRVSCPESFTVTLCREPCELRAPGLYAKQRGLPSRVPWLSMLGLNIARGTLSWSWAPQSCCLSEMLQVSRSKTGLESLSHYVWTQGWSPPGQWKSWVGSSWSLTRNIFPGAGSQMPLCLSDRHKLDRMPNLLSVLPLLPLVCHLLCCVSDLTFSLSQLPDPSPGPR